MRLDMSHALRHDECLPHPSALAGARWGLASVDPKSVSPKNAPGHKPHNLPNTSIHARPSGKMPEEPHRISCLNFC